MERLTGRRRRASGWFCELGTRSPVTRTGPAPAEATGLEVDKLNRDYVKNYVDGYLKMYSGVVGPGMMGEKGNFVFYSPTASRWVRKTGPITFCSEFEKRRGYDARISGCLH
jgi:hypothetical protein